MLHNDVARLGERVVGDFGAGDEVDLIVEVFLLALAYALVSHLVEFWAFFELDVEKHLAVGRGGCDADADIGKKSLPPKFFDGACDLVARNGNLLTYFESRNLYYRLLVEVLDARYCDAFDNIVLG